jgi:hypothetical protein
VTHSWIYGCVFEHLTPPDNTFVLQTSLPYGSINFQQSVSIRSGAFALFRTVDLEKPDAIRVG